MRDIIEDRIKNSGVGRTEEIFCVVKGFETLIEITPWGDGDFALRVTFKDEHLFSSIRSKRKLCDDIEERLNELIRRMERKVGAKQ